MLKISTVFGSKTLFQVNLKSVVCGLQFIDGLLDYYYYI